MELKYDITNYDLRQMQELTNAIQEGVDLTELDPTKHSAEDLKILGRLKRIGVDIQLYAGYTTEKLQAIYEAIEYKVDIAELPLEVMTPEEIRVFTLWLRFK